MNKLKGVDISENNGVIDFEKLSENVDFVMIRATFGRFKEDRNFKKNVEGCLLYNIPFGVYCYSYALNVAQGMEETANLLKVIAPYKEYITYPVVIDMEDSDNYKQKNGFPKDEVLSEICNNFCEKIKENGYIPMIYASAYWYKQILKDLKDYPKWIAWWDIKEENIDSTKYQMWQYTSKGRIKGIETNVDFNYSFIDYKTLTTYLRNVEKISYIKFRTGLEDLTIQFMSCYKWGQDLIDKIYKRLKEAPIKKSSDEIKNIVKKEYNLESKTITFLSYYLYGEPLFLKLYRAICEDEITLQENKE